MLTLIVGGSLVAGSDNPHRGTLMPLGPSTLSVGLGIFGRLILSLALAGRWWLKNWVGLGFNGDRLHVQPP
jgi:hypothetical protein